MPINYKHYPPHWKELREQVLERDGHKCKHCGLPNGQTVHSITFDKLKYWFVTWRGLANVLELFPRERYGDDIKTFKVVLTIAHLDHDERNHNVSPDRLAALCQRCHLRYDAKEKAFRRANKYA